MIASHELDMPDAVEATYDAIAPVPADGESPATLAETDAVAEFAMDAAECVTTQTTQTAQNEPACATLDSAAPAEVAPDTVKAIAVATPMHDPVPVSALTSHGVEAASALESETTTAGNETEIVSAIVTTPNLNQAMTFVTDHATAHLEPLEEPPATLIASDLAGATIADVDEASNERANPSEPAAPCTVGQLVEIEPASVPESETPTLVHVHVATELTNMPSAPCMDSSVTDTAAPAMTKMDATEAIDGDTPAAIYFEGAVSVVADESDVTPGHVPAMLAYESDVHAATRVLQAPAEMRTIDMNEDAEPDATVAHSETAATAPIPTEAWHAEGAAHVSPQQEGTSITMPNAPTAESATPPSVAGPISTGNAAPASMATVKQDDMPVALVQMENPAYAMALKFAERGIAVFPLFGIEGDHCTCGNSIESEKCSAGKHPRLSNTFNGAAVNKMAIDVWFKYNRMMNYGIATGRKGNTDKVLVVVDIDWYKQEAQQTVEDLNSAGYFFPDTAEVLTGGGGRHLYYWAKAGTKFTKTAGPGIDLKGEGGYVVGPGSMHKSGLRYEFEASSDLFDGQKIAEMPQWMYDKFCKPEAVAVPQSPLDAHAAPRNDEVSDAEIATFKDDLEMISPLDYDTWCKVLMALKNRSDSEKMFNVADWWSQKAGYKDVDAVRKTWNSIKGEGGITIKSLKRLVAEAVPNTDVDVTGIMVANARVTPGDEIAWPTPEPICFGIQAEPYPLDALPEMLKSAVIEVQSFTKAPIAMVVCSALSTLSLAAQALYDIKRAEGLTGPIGLFMLTVANSGERKTTLDGLFSAPIHEYEARCAVEAKTTLSEFTADLSAWEATRKGILDGITKAVSGKNPTTSNAALRAHEITLPLRPLVPRLVYGDVTPEALKHNLAVEWPSGGIISSEGGAVFGGHGMKKDNQMGNLATLNELWDGKPGRTDRRTTQAAILKNARLTVAIQVQEPTLKAFLGGSNALARGTGFLARFLIAWPTTTMGTRTFVEPPQAWPMRDRFRLRVTEILNSPQPIVDRELKPNMLILTTGAKVAWVAFHNEIELQLGLTGSYHAVCDVASKAADNAVRIAALFHVLEGVTDAVSETHMVGASRIARWHLNESFRLYAGLTVPQQLEAASKLDDWLVAYCKKENVQEISTKNLMQLGPNTLRKKAMLMPVVEQLVSLGRVKISVAPATTIYVNPALLE